MSKEIMMTRRAVIKGLGGLGLAVMVRETGPLQEFVKTLSDKELSPEDSMAVDHALESKKGISNEAIIKKAASNIAASGGLSIIEGKGSGALTDIIDGTSGLPNQKEIAMSATVSTCLSLSGDTGNSFLRNNIDLLGQRKFGLIYTAATTLFDLYNAK